MVIKSDETFQSILCAAHSTNEVKKKTEKVRLIQQAVMIR